MWRKRLQDILTDVCKYIITALVLSTLFEGVEGIGWMMFWAVLLVVLCFALTVMLESEPKKYKRKRSNKKR